MKTGMKLIQGALFVLLFFVCRLHTLQASDSRRNDRRTQNSPGGRIHDTGLSFVNYPGQRFGV